MEDFIVTYNESNDREIQYLFTSKNTNLKKGYTHVDSKISKFDTISQVKKKICVYVCQFDLKLSININQLYLWINTTDSPFIKNGKKSELSDNKYENNLIYNYLNKSNEIHFTIRSQLKKKVDQGKDTAKWVESWINANSSNDKMEKSQIDNIIEHTNFIKDVENTKLPKKTLPIKRFRHTMIFVDLVLSKENKGIGLDINKIFKHFPLNNNVPLIKLGTKSNSKTKVYKPAIKNELDTKFWKKWQKEDDKEKNLQIKFMYEFSTVQLTIYNNSSISLRCSGDITTDNWKKIYEKVLEWIIVPINRLIDNNITPLKYENLKYRLINSKTLIKKNVNLKPSLIQEFGRYVPYFSISLEGKLRFIKVTDYLTNKVNIVDELYNLYNRDEKKTAKRVGILFMISDDEADEELNIFVNDKLIRNSNNDTKVIDESALGDSIKITYDSEYIKIIHTGKNPEEIDYAVNILRKMFYIHRIGDSVSKKSIDDDSDSDSDSDEDIDALIANVNDSDSDSDSDSDEDDNLDNNVIDESSSESESEDDTENEAKEDNSWYKLSSTKRPKEPQKDFKRIRFGLPPAGWNPKKTKAGNIRTYRSERLKFYDPELFNMKFSETGKKVNRKDGKVEYSTSCAPTQSHPIAFNHAEHDKLLEILKNYVDDGHPEIKDRPRILDWLEHRNVWYLSCECICVGCMLPIRIDELGKNEECPKCKSNNYTIRNDSKFTGNKIKLGPAKYNLSVWPCRRIRDQLTNPKKAPDMSSYILSKDRFNIELGRLGDLPDLMHKMFGNRSDISKGPLPKSGEPFILRYGIYEKSFDDSFIKAISILYGKNEQIIIDTMIQNLRDVKQFVRTCEGSLIQLFSAKRDNDVDESKYKVWFRDQTIKGSFSDKHMRNIFNSYSNFCDFMNDKTIDHDHNIMWPIMCYPGVLWEYGLNLYLFKTDKKTGNTAEYICPPNGNPFYYHYTEEFVTNKTAFFVFSTMFDGRYFYEPCAKIKPSDKKLKSPQMLFDSFPTTSNTDSAWNSIAPLRQHCGTTLQDKYVSYLRKNRYKLYPLPYTSNLPYLSQSQKELSAKNILELLKLKPKAQVINSKYQSTGLIVEYEQKKFYIPIQSRSIILHLDILERIPCSNIGDFTLSCRFYEWLSNNKMRTKPLEYIVDLKTNKINGIVLETNNIVPVKPSPISGNTRDLKRSTRPTYECDKDEHILDERANYINDFNNFWEGYNQFCMNIAINIKNSKTKIDDKNVEISKDIIKKHSKSLVNDEISNHYLTILLKEYDYNYVRRNDIKTGRKPQFLLDLEDTKTTSDTKTFTDNESKDYYIKNQKRQSTYAKYIPYYNPDNLDILTDSKLYSISNIGLKLSKTWQKILHKDFRYADYDNYAWIDKVVHISMSDILIELQNKGDWAEISNKIESCVAILDNQGKVTIWSESKTPKFYLLFYVIDRQIYPIFLMKNGIQQFGISSEDISTEFLEKIGGNCVGEYQTKQSSSLHISEEKKTEEKKTEKKETEEKKTEKKETEEKKTEKKETEENNVKPYCKLLDKKVYKMKRCVRTKLKSEDSDQCVYNDKTRHCRIKK